jgi:hypothetical protein
MVRRRRKHPNSGDVSRERVNSRSSPDARVPDPDDAVPGTGCEPRRMVRRLGGASRFVQRECLLARIWTRRRKSTPAPRWPSGHGVARLFGARWPELGLAGLRGGGKLLVVFVFIIFTAGRMCAAHSALLGCHWKGSTEQDVHTHPFSSFLLDRDPDRK